MTTNMNDNKEMINMNDNKDGSIIAGRERLTVVWGMSGERDCGWRGRGVVTGVRCRCVTLGVRL